MARARVSTESLKPLASETNSSSANAVVDAVTVPALVSRESEQLERIATLLSQINRATLRITTREALFTTVCQMIVESGICKIATVGCVDEKTHRLLPVAQHGDDAGYLEKIVEYGDGRPEGQGAGASACREGTPIVINDLVKDERTSRWHLFVKDCGVHSVVAFPIRVHNKCVGALSLYASTVGYFEQRAVRLLDQVAGALGIALENYERDALRTQACQLADANEAHYRALFDHAPEAILLYDVEHNRIVEANQTATQLFGCPRDALLESKLEQYTPTAHAENVPVKLREHEERALQGIPQCYEQVIHNAKNQVLRCEVRLTAFPDAKRKLLRISYVDVTERHKTDIASMQNMRLLNTALEVIETGLCQTSLKDNSTQRTPRHDKIFGYTSLLPDWSYETFLHHVIPDDRLRVDKLIQDAIKSQSVWDIECKISRKDKTTRSIRYCGCHLRNEEGVATHLLAIVQDISERAHLSNPSFIKLEALIPKIRNLPPNPQILPKLMLFFRNPNSDYTKIIELISFDSSLVAEVLRMANSAYYSRRERVTNLQNAVNLIGFREMYRVTSSVIGAQAVGSALSLYNLKKNALLQQSICSACLMEELAEITNNDKAGYYTLGLLHVCGKVVVQHAWVLSQIPIPTIPPTPEQEKEAIGFNYAEAGAALMKHWNFAEEFGLIIKEHIFPDVKSEKFHQAIHLHLASRYAPLLMEPDDNQEIPIPALLESAELNAEQWKGILLRAKEKSGEVLKSIKA
ncbi:MAG: HDOD domain-containing protein [Verrucomicrobiota bacterium]|nr:HDOD domain-containing protein [Verrucomicrobiota bacterium]